MSDAPRITLQELKKRMEAGERFIFVDVRNRKDWGESDVKIPGAIRVPMDEFEQHLTEIPRDQPIVSYCT